MTPHETGPRARPDAVLPRATGRARPARVPLRAMIPAALAGAALGWVVPAGTPGTGPEHRAPTDAAMAERLVALWPASRGQAERIVRRVHAEADRHGLDPCLVMGVIARESGFRSRARNDRDLGLMQLNTHWHAQRVAALGGERALFDVDRNIRAGTAVLADYRARSASDEGALQRYHGLGKRNDYVDRVLREADRLRSAGACAGALQVAMR